MRLPRNPRQLARMLLVTTRAFGSNAVNRISPRLHGVLRGATGRGPEVRTPEDIAAHFRRSFFDYFTQLGVEADSVPEFLRGRSVLEYGPGDLPGVALLCLAHGAERVTCVDRFPLLRFSPTNQRALDALAESLDPRARARLDACFEGPRSDGVLRADKLRCLVSGDGLSGLHGEIDLAISCAVLEHVNRLDLTLADMAEALRPGGLACHVVDLASHGFEWGHPLDFLTVPPWAWRLMSSHNGSLTNRLRLSDHRRILEGLPLADVELRPTITTSEDVAVQALEHLPGEWRDRDRSDLTTLGYWLIARRR